MKAKRPKLNLPFEYGLSRDCKIVSLEPDGVLCVPVLGFSDYHAPRARAKPHTHPECMEISCCLRGELTFSCKGRDYPFRPGSVFVTWPGERHCLTTPDKGLRMYWMFFRVPGRGFPLLHLPPAEAAWLKERLLHLPNRLFTATKRVQAAFQHAFAVYSSEPARTAERRLKMRSAVVEILLALVEASAQPPDEPRRGRVEALIEEIRRNPGADYSVDALASQAALSPSNLALRFKALVGVPPHAFVVACRIKAAKGLLADPRRRIADIAAELGFPSAQHFSTQFKNATGQTPAGWRRSHSD